MKKKEGRRKMFGAVHIRWKQLRPDLKHHPSDEAREQLLMFAESRLGVGGLASLSELNSPQLARLLDVMNKELEQPALAGMNVARLHPLATACGTDGTDGGVAARGGDGGGGEVEHLAGAEQVWAITRLFDYLGWREAAREAFLTNKFKRSQAPHLRPNQANSCLMILFTIASSRDLKREGAEKVTREMIRGYIPQLKVRLGIDLK